MDTMNTPEQQEPDTLAGLWEAMQLEKGDLNDRSEEYARWTLPYICPVENTSNQEQEQAEVAIGPRLVNNLANRVIDVMYPHERPFFTLALTPEAKKKLSEELQADPAELAMAVREETSAVEQVAMRKMDLTKYRPKAVEVVKHLLITGNAVLKRMPDGKRRVYGVKSIAIRRRPDGTVTQIMLKDCKKFKDLPQDLKDKVRTKRNPPEDWNKLTLYTHYEWVDGRWAMTQAVEDIDLDTTIYYTPQDFPVLVLAWNLADGENYGRGLVEDHATVFHQVDVLTTAAMDMAGIMADVKFFVNPSSVVDVHELNTSARGSYHVGREDDVTVPDLARRLEIQQIKALIDAAERELSQAFLLNTSAIRDAERVTAEEIRLIAMELEGAFGGLYSRLAVEWQQYEAEYTVAQIDFKTELPGSKVPAFEVIVTTGLETLSRQGQLEGLRRALADLQMLDTVPEDLRAAIDPEKFAAFVFDNHAVKWREFLYSRDEMEANQQKQLQQQQQLADIAASQKVQEEAGKKAVQES